MFIFSLPPSSLRGWVLAVLFALVPTAFAAGKILIHGDSLSAGYGIRRDAAWPALLEPKLKKEGFDYTVINVSISGETTSGGLARLPAALKRHRPVVVVIALGSNDGLRGIPVAVMRGNVEAMARIARAAGSRVLVVGQRLPPNFGNYADGFHAAFGEAARAQKAAYVDFLLDGVADRPEFFQPDNLHPTAEAQPRLLENVWKGLGPLLKRGANPRSKP
ncbi:MAG: arylesterase [Candidatus Accumulibacter sp.]|jgi:acyl-CoA thioesterase-1|nr:arylesterase [Accumulibacter sp.]